MKRFVGQILVSIPYMGKEVLKRLAANLMKNVSIPYMGKEVKNGTSSPTWMRESIGFNSLYGQGRKL